MRSRTSGHTRSNSVVIATIENKRYLVSMLGSEADWVKNVQAAHGDAVIRQGRRRNVHLVLVPPEERALRRAPILKEYVRIARSGRQHSPLAVGASLFDFEAIAERYPVYRIDPEGNSYIERFHRSLKEEEVWLNEYERFDQARRNIARWIEEYNHDRPHRGLHGRTSHDARAVFAQTLTSNTAPSV